MKILRTPIDGLLLIEPRVFHDERGYFFESFSEKQFSEHTGLALKFVQDNESMSQKGVLRGLHLQVPPFAQGKLVRVSRGSVYDVAVDLRMYSPTYGQWYGAELSAENKRQLFIPPGFAHGFAVLEDYTIFTYKCTGYYHKESERCIQWNDPHLAITWPQGPHIISERDQNQCIAFKQFQTPFDHVR